jgi:uncharacterized membrane protein YfcA
MIWVFIGATALIAGTIGGVVGFGSSIMLMPVLVLGVGPREAVPIMAIAGLMANLSRVWVWYRDVDWRAVAAWSVTAIPAAALGARTLVTIDPRIVETSLGLLFLAMIPARRWLLSRDLSIGLWHLALVGCVIGFMSGMVATTGPINTPFFLAYGLVKGPYLSTEAMGSFLVGVTKAAVFRTFGALPWEIAGKGALVGAALTCGSWLAKGLVTRLDASQFRGLMDALLFFAGLAMLYGALVSH